MTIKIRLCILGTTVLTRQFIVATERGHLSDRSTTDFSEVNVKFVAMQKNQ